MPEGKWGSKRRGYSQKMTPFQYLKISKLISLLVIFEHQNLEEIFISRVHFGVTGSP